MTRTRALALTLLLVAGVLAVLVSGVVPGSGGLSGAQEQFGRQPTFIPAAAQTPAPTPPDGRQVALLTLSVTSNSEGKLEDIVLRQGRILSSYAPNVFDRQGEWMVELVSGDQRTVRFGTQDPRRVEVENPSGETSPLTTMIEPDASWELVVPLYDDDKDLKVEKIIIYDQEGKEVFTTPVDRERWSGT
jgi:hypothetical protein